MEESTTGIGRIRRVSLRQVWPREDYDFTPWLQENLDVLNDALGIELASADREEAAGDFSVDLLAEDDEGRLTVIENQLGRSDHDHLGKVLTYLSAFDAEAAIWLTSEARPEHVSAVSWLNENSAGADFYLVKVEAIRIGESRPAPLFTEIVGPSEEARRVGEKKQELSERHHLREQFWKGLLKRSDERTDRFSNISPKPQRGLTTSARPGLYFKYAINQHEGRATFKIDFDERERNQRILDQLKEHREEIKEAVGVPTSWMEDSSRRRAIVCHIERGGYRDEDDWPAVQEEMVEAMVRLEKVLQPHLDRLNL